MTDKSEIKIFKTLHWWMLTCLAVMDQQRIELKTKDPETAAKMQHFINEIGGRVGYAELKALDFKAMKLLKHSGATFLTRWYWRLKGKALDKEFDELKARTWVLAQYEFEKHQWAIFFDLVYRCKPHFATFWPDELNKFFGHINDANMNFHERVIV